MMEGPLRYDYEPRFNGYELRERENREFVDSDSEEEIGNENRDVLLQEFEKSDQGHQNSQNNTIPPDPEVVPPSAGQPHQPPKGGPYQHHPPRYHGRTEMGSKYDEEPCCGISLLKYVLFIFNFFLLLAGAAVLVIGVWTFISKTDYMDLLCSNVYYFSVVLLIVSGALIMILAATGCYGAVQEVQGCLLVYFTFLLLLCIIEIAVAIFLCVFSAQLQTHLENCLNETLSTNYGKEDQQEFTKNFDDLQRSFKCCGSVGYLDWQTSYWNSSGLAGKRQTPDSCCKTESNECAVRDHPSNINRYGCVTGLKVYLSESLVIIMLVFLAIGLVELVGLLFTMCLYCHLKYEAEDL